MTKVVLCPTWAHTPYIVHVHTGTSMPHIHVYTHSHTSTHSGEEGSVHSLLKLFQPFKFSQEPHSAVNSHFRGDSRPFRTFQSDLVAVTAWTMAGKIVQVETLGENAQRHRLQAVRMLQPFSSLWSTCRPRACLMQTFSM